MGARRRGVGERLVLPTVLVVGLVLAQPTVSAEATSPLPWDAGPPVRGEAAWAGEVSISGTAVVAEDGVLRVAPGTVVTSADPGARLVVNGTLEAVGTPSRPVVLEVSVVLSGGEASGELGFSVLRPPTGTALRVGPDASLGLRTSRVEGGAGGVLVEADGDRDLGRSVVVDRSVLHGAGEDPGPGEGAGLRLAVLGDAETDDGTFHGMVRVVDNRFVGNDVGLEVDGWSARGLRLEGNHLEGNDVGVHVVDGNLNLHDPTFEDNDVDAHVADDDSTLRLDGEDVGDVDMRVAEGASAEAGDVVVRENPRDASRVAAALASGLLLLYGLLKYLVPRGLLARLLYRKEDEELLEHEARREILERLRQEPGLHLRELGRLVDGYRRAVYHARVLEDADIVRAERDGGYKRFYPADHPCPGHTVGKGKRAGVEAMTVPLRSTRAKLKALVQQHPGIEQAQAARKLDCSRQLASYHAQRLENDGEIRRRESRGRMRLYPPQ